MSGYQYTYETRDDYKGFDTLTDSARALGDDVNRRARAGESSGDRYLLLVAATGSAEDKAALAELWGGPGASKEFRS